MRETSCLRQSLAARWGGESGEELRENKIAGMQQELKQNAMMLQGRDKELKELRRQSEAEKSASKFWEQDAQKQAQEGMKAKVQAIEARQREKLAVQREQEMYGRVVQDGAATQQREVALQHIFEEARKKIEE